MLTLVKGPALRYLRKMAENETYTKHFLQTLTGAGEDWDQIELWWRAISPDGGRPRILNGSYRDLEKELHYLNASGYGIFLQINPATGTKDKDVTGVRALFVDCDTGDLPSTWPLTPNIVVNSGHGQHAYWLVAAGTDVATFTNAQKALAMAMGTDPAVCNPSRIMRVPGFQWTKETPTKLVTCSVGDRGGAPSPIAVIVNKLTNPPPSATEAWAEYRLVCLANTVLSAPPRTSQDTFNRCVYEAKDYVRAGLLDGDLVRSVLMAAADTRGVDGPEATYESASGAESASRSSGVAGDGGGLLFPSGQEEDIARALIEAWGGPARCASVGGSLYRYVDATGVWGVYTDAALRSLVASYHGSPYMKDNGATGRLNMSISLRTRVAQALLEAPSIYVGSMEEWTSGGVGAGGGVAFSNGFLTPDGTVHPHGPENRALWAFDFEIDPIFALKGNLPPKWNSFLSEVWGDVGEGEREARIAYLGAYVGSCVLGVAPVWGKLLLAYGPTGSNGKSILLGALRSILGPSRCVSVPPNSWSEPYHRVRLRPPALLNLVHELPEGDWLNSEIFKTIVTGDQTDGREPYGRPQEFLPVCGHICALNELPGSGDRTEAFWRRLDVLPFTVCFRGREANPKHLAAALVAEGPEFIRWAVGWALASIEAGRLPDFQGSDEIKVEWAIDNDPVAVWLEQRCTAPGEWTQSGELFADFNVWLAENGYRQKTSNWFGRQLRRLGIASRKVHGQKQYAVELGRR